MTFLDRFVTSRLDYDGYCQTCTRHQPTGRGQRLQTLMRRSLLSLCPSSSSLNCSNTGRTVSLESRTRAGGIALRRVGALGLEAWRRAFVARQVQIYKSSEGQAHLLAMPVQMIVVLKQATSRGMWLV